MLGGWRPRRSSATATLWPIELRPGVSFVVRAGWRGEWDVRETVRKVYVIWKATETA